MVNDKKRNKIKKKYFVFGFIILLFILLFFGTKLYLYFNFLIGNDFVISLNADKANFFLNHGSQDKVIFKSQVFSNPLCSSNCTSQFINLGNGEIINKRTFNLKPTAQDIQEYSLFANKSGKGQDLYRFEIKCMNVKATFCQTNGEEKTRDILITLDYDLNDSEKQIKNQSKENISLKIQKLDYMQKNLIEINSTVLNLFENNTPENFSVEIINISDSINSINETYFNLIKLWENSEYINLESEIINSEKYFQNLETKFDNLNQTIYNLTLNNNYEIDNLTYAQQKLEILKNENVSFNETLEINLMIKEFNSIAENKSNYNQIYDFVNKLDGFNLSGGKCCYASEIVSNVSLSKIYLFEVNESSTAVNFLEPESKCCFLGNCSSCDNTNKTLDYPIIFVHGHSFNHKISAEYSFDTFEKMQSKLEQDNYINAGTIISTSAQSDGIFGRANYPFSFRASYYFDIFKNSETVNIIQAKQDSIDTYAIRLNDIVNEVKLETGKDKVIIIAHSMGGLVSRRYLQIFGENSVDKLIMIGTPNNGISKKIYDYCKLFGSAVECDNMDAGSLFINKVNQDVLQIPTYNIIGLGCDMSGQNGDGIVENSSAYLSFARNYYINGTCPGTFDFLHLNMVYPEQYPEVYKIVTDALKE